MPRKGMSERKKIMKNTNLRNKKDMNKIVRVLKNSKLNWLLEADSIEIFPLNRGEMNISFVFEGYEPATGMYHPLWCNYYFLLRNGQVKIEKRGGTCYITPVDQGYEKTWLFDKRGKLLWESPSEEYRRGSRPCRK